MCRNRGGPGPALRYHPDVVRETASPGGHAGGGGERRQAPAAPPHRRALDVLLLALALPLARRAQRVTDTPLDELVAELARRRRSAVVAPDRVALAAARATARWSRWFGGLDSCLTRSLVAGAMLAGRGGVALHIGFRPGQGERESGWLSSSN